MTDFANFIRFGEENTLTGNIASISYDLDITGKENRSTNPDAPVYRFLPSPREVDRSRSARSGSGRTRAAVTTTASLSAPATGG